MPVLVGLEEGAGEEGGGETEGKGEKEGGEGGGCAVHAPAEDRPGETSGKKEIKNEGERPAERTRELMRAGRARD